MQCFIKLQKIERIRSANLQRAQQSQEQCVKAESIRPLSLDEVWGLVTL